MILDNTQIAIVFAILIFWIFARDRDDL